MYLQGARWIMAWRVEACKVCCQAAIGAALGGVYFVFTFGLRKEKKLGGGPC